MQSRTVCEAVNFVCRVDVGMSWGCGYGSPQALEVINDTKLFRILEDGTRVPVNDAAAADANHQVSWWKRQPAQSTSGPAVAAAIS